MGEGTMAWLIIILHSHYHVQGEERENKTCSRSYENWRRKKSDLAYQTFKLLICKLKEGKMLSETIPVFYPCCKNPCISFPLSVFFSVMSVLCVLCWLLLAENGQGWPLPNKGVMESWCSAFLKALGKNWIPLNRDGKSVKNSTDENLSLKK